MSDSIFFYLDKASEHFLGDGALKIFIRVFFNARNERRQPVRPSPHL